MAASNIGTSAARCNKQGAPWRPTFFKYAMKRAPKLRHGAWFHGPDELWVVDRLSSKIDILILANMKKYLSMTILFN